MHAYGRVTELSWLLNADTEAAEVMLSGRVPLGDGSRNKGFLELGHGTAKDLQSLFRQFREPVSLQVSDSGGLVTLPHAHEGLCSGR